MIYADTSSVMNWFLVLAPVVCCVFASRTLLHYFQLESYQFPGYFRTLKRNWKHSLLPGVCAAAGLIIITYLAALLGMFRAAALWLRLGFGVIYLLVSAGLGLLIARVFNAKNAKKFKYHFSKWDGSHFEGCLNCATCKMIYNVKESCCKEGGKHTEKDALDHKREMDESVCCADSLHNADFELSAEHCDSNCVRDNDKSNNK